MQQLTACHQVALQVQVALRRLDTCCHGCSCWLRSLCCGESAGATWGGSECRGSDELDENWMDRFGTIWGSMRYKGGILCLDPDWSQKHLKLPHSHLFSCAHMISLAVLLALSPCQDGFVTAMFPVNPVVLKKAQSCTCACFGRLRFSLCKIILPTYRTYRVARVSLE